MSKTWAKTFPSENDSRNSAEFYWSIEKFDIVWAQNGGSGIDSPPFEIMSELQTKKVYLKVRSFLQKSGNDLFFVHDSNRFKPYRIEETFYGVANQLSFSDSLFLKFEICSDQNCNGFDMAGSLNIETPQKHFNGMFGKVSVPEEGLFQEKFQFQKKDWIFKNKTFSGSQTVSIEGTQITSNAYRPYDRGQDRKFILDDIFCIPKTTNTMVLKVKLNTPLSTTVTTDEFSFLKGGPPRLLADIKSMLDRSSENGDFIIECGGERFPCHEFMLRTRSSVLEGMLGNHMLERENKSLKLEDVGSNTVAVALEYMYTGEVAKDIESVQELIYFAEKYNMDDLLALCFEKLPQDDEDMVVDCLIMADKLNLAVYKTLFMRRIHAKKSKFLNDEVSQEKLKEFPHLLLELLKI